MALRVWLPLNGNLENQGLSNCIVANSGATIDNSGKIGKTYLFDANDDFISIDSADMRNIFKGGDTPFTIAFWIYNTKATGTRAVPFGDYGLAGTIQFNLELNSSAGNWNDDIRFYWNGNPDYRATGTSAAPNTWVHLAIVYDGTKVEFYRNGILVNTRTGTLAALNKTSGAFYLGRDNRTGGTAFGGKINDLRIYDECLSPKQIKEISKGLVAHYKLDGPKANENLILRSDKITSGSQASGITRTYMDDGTLKVVSTSGNGNYCSIGFAENSNTNVGNKLSVGDTYTISCDIKVEEGTAFPTLFINSGNGYKQLGGPTLRLNTWQRVYYTNTWNEPGTGYGNIALHLGFSSAIGTYYFKNFKLEKGNFTPWIPAPTDLKYTQFGYGNTYGIDASGNQYHGTPTGSLTYSPDSARYSGSTKFEANSANYIWRPEFAFLTGPLTYNCWVYQIAATPTTQFIMSQGRDNTCNGFNLSCANGIPKLWAGGNDKIQITGTTSIVDSKWHMLTGTWDGTTAKLYVDGNLIGSAAMGDITYTQSSGAFVIGKMSYSYTSTTNYFPFNGNISDARVYATALSDDDIKELYQTSAWVDNRQNIMAYEFKEV